MKHTPEEQLRELIRQAIREELKQREVKKDPETGVTTSHLVDKDDKRVGYSKHKELPTGGFVVGGRLGPKAAEKNVDETTDVASDADEPNNDDDDKKTPPMRRKDKRSKDKRSIEDIAREMGQIEMFQEQTYTVDEWVHLMNEYRALAEAKLTPSDAKNILDKHDAHDDFHALRSDKVSALLGAAKDAKYRKGKGAPGSTGRMFHQHLTKLARKTSDVTEANTPPSDDQGNKYNKDSVDKAIEASNRAGRKIGKSEADKIHRLLKGWRGNIKKD
jgi:hypothetical protein